MNPPQEPSRERRSQCCGAPITTDGGGVGIFSLTTGSLICTNCHKYCCYAQPTPEQREDERLEKEVIKEFLKAEKWEEKYQKLFAWQFKNNGVDDSRLKSFIFQVIQQERADAIRRVNEEANKRVEEAEKETALFILSSGTDMKTLVQAAERFLTHPPTP